MNYIIQAEKAVTSLRKAKEVISDGLIIAMILKGFLESYKPFTIHMTQSSETLTFVQFKIKLLSYEETEKFNTIVKSDNVMKADMSSIVALLWMWKPRPYRERLSAKRRTKLVQLSPKLNTQWQDMQEKDQAQRWCKTSSRRTRRPRGRTNIGIQDQSNISARQYQKKQINGSLWSNITHRNWRKHFHKMWWPLTQMHITWS